MCCGLALLHRSWAPGLPDSDAAGFVPQQMRIITVKRSRAVKVLLVNRFFGGSQVPTGRMLLDVARELKRSGHEVEVLTSSGRYACADAGTDEADAFRIRRLSVTGSHFRLFAWLSFCVQAWFVIPSIDFDLAILLTDPPFLLPAAWRTKHMDRARGERPRRIFWWTMDLYPEALIASGMFRTGGIVHQFLRWLNELGMQALDGIVCLGEQQHRLIRNYHSLRRSEAFTEVVPPWDNRPLRAVPRSENRFLKEMQLGGRRVALYAGNLGQAHTYRDFVRAAHHLQSQGRDDWRFVFVCRGAGRRGLERESRELKNVIVRDYVSPDMTPDLLHAADVHLITLNPIWNGIVVPSKLYGVLKTSAPVLFVGPEDADSAIEIRRLGAGRVLPVGCDPELMIETLDEMAAGGMVVPRQISGASVIAAIVAEEALATGGPGWSRRAA